MRTLVLKMSVSLDGFVSGPNGETDWMFSGDGAAIAWIVETIADASLHIMGSSTFRDMAAFWPTSSLPFAAPMNRIPKVVFSRRASALQDVMRAMQTLDEASATAGPAGEGRLQPGAESWRAARIAGGDLSDEIARLKDGEGKPIVAHGGAAFARSLIAAGLVDRYALLVHPVLLGRGTPIFDGIERPRCLELVSATAFPKGSVAQVYRAS